MISVAHLQDGDEVTTCALLVRGDCDEEVTVRVGDEPVPTDVGAGRFKALVPLAVGANEIQLGSVSLQIIRRRVEPIVRIIYKTAADGDPSYQSPLEDDPQNAHDKLVTSLVALQAFAAEALVDAGHDRKAFTLDPIVHELHGQLPSSAYDLLDDSTWYDQVKREIHGTFGQSDVKNAVIVSYTRFDSIDQSLHNHTALGGEDVGLFGSGGLFCWPSNLRDVRSTFHDVTKIDGTQVFDDSNKRSRWWALASTTLGATLHELGHCFGLPHCEDAYCVMTRGFDYLNRAFTVVEPPHALNPDGYAFGPKEEARWCAQCAAHLAEVF